MKNYKASNKSTRQCCVRECNSKCTKKISLHRFPSDPNMKKKWSLILNTKNITKGLFVCSLHFVKSDYVPSTNFESRVNRLKKDALPSQNIPALAPGTRKSELGFNEVEENEETLSNILKNRIKTDITKRSIIGYINTDTQLKEFCGIPNSSLLYEIVDGMKSMLLNKKPSDESLTHRVLLAFIKIKLDLSLTCLSALFQIEEDTCKIYLNETIECLRSLLYYIVENFPENGEIIKVLIQINNFRINTHWYS